MDWRPTTPQEALVWLAGLWEGEGNFSLTNGRHVTARIGMVDRDVIELVADLLGRDGIRYERRKNYQTLWRVGIGGQEGIDFMLAIRPFLSERRQGQIDHCVSNWSGTRRTLTWDVVVNIRQRADAGESITALAKEYGLNRKVVEHIRERRTYRQPRGWSIEANL